MAQILIEDNFQHIDGLDMEALIAGFAEQGFRAEPTQRQTSHKGAGWVLVLHWLGDETGRPAAEAALVAMVDSIRALYRIKRSGVGERTQRKPPVRMDLNGPDGHVITSVAVPRE
jgi:hypothetical protein